MTGYVHRPGKTGRRAIQQSALQVLLGCEGDRMDEAVQPTPASTDLVEQRLQLARNFDVERRHNLGAELLPKRLDVRPCFVVKPGNGELGARGTERFGAAKGNRLIVGDADDQRLVPGQERPAPCHSLTPTGPPPRRSPGGRGPAAGRPRRKRAAPSPHPRGWS